MLHETTETSLRALCEEPNIMYQQISSTLHSDRRDHNVALTLYLFSESILMFLQYRAQSLLIGKWDSEDLCKYKFPLRFDV